LNHLEIYILSHNQIIINAVRYNPAILAKSDPQVVLQSSNIMHKVKAAIKQIWNKRLSTKLLRGEIYDFMEEGAIARGLESLIKNSSDLYPIEVFNFYIGYSCTTSSPRRHFEIGKGTSLNSCKVSPGRRKQTVLLLSWM
jgi:hypothetical protein